MKDEAKTSPSSEHYEDDGSNVRLNAEAKDKVNQCNAKNWLCATCILLTEMK